MKHYEHFRYYIVPASMEEVWGAYCSADPRTAFQGEVIDFGLVHSGDKENDYTADDLRYNRQGPSLREGQKYILELNYNRFYSIPVAFMISEVDSRDHIIEFRYLDKNFVHGKQRIRFIPTGDNSGEPATVIEHYTVYNSGNKILDTFLYAGFHSTVIDEMHSSITSSIGIDLEIPAPDEADVFPQVVTAE